MGSVDLVADAILSTEGLLTRYLAGFDDANATAQSPNLPNHAAWCLGHLALTMHRAAERIADETIELDWDPEPFAFGSTPSPDRDGYPPLDELQRRVHNTLHQLADAVRKAGEAGLAREVPWGNTRTTARDLALRMVFHNGLHCGQMVDLRRALGFAPVIQ